MPVEDYLQKQIDQFAMAMASLIAQIVDDTNYPNSSMESDVQTLLCEHLDASLEQISNMSEPELIEWFNSPLFSADNAGQFVSIMSAIAQYKKDVQLCRHTIALIDIINRRMDSISVSRIEMRKELEIHISHRE